MLKGSRWLGITVWLIGAGAVLSIPRVIDDEYLLHMIIMAGIWTLQAASLNIVMGYCGLFNMANGTLYGIGAYASALLTINLGLSFWLALPIASVLTAALGAVIAYPALRTKGLYFAIVTMGLAWIGSQVFENWKEVTGGPNGIPGIAPPSPIALPFLGTIEFTNKVSIAYLVLVITVVSLYLMSRIVNSRFGRTLLAIKEDEDLARSSGFDVTHYKAVAFAISSLFVGIAGSLYAHYFQFISPETFSLHTTLTVISMVVIGGQATVPGPIVGALLMNFLPEYLRVASQFRLVIYALVFLLVMLFMPRGIVGALGGLARLRVVLATRLGVGEAPRVGTGDGQVNVDIEPR